MSPSRRHRKRGTSPVEVLVAVALVGLLLLLVLMALPRNRETARLATCNDHLMRIGQVMAYYDGAVGHLPTTAPLGEGGESPQAKGLGLLGLGDLQGVGRTGSNWRAGRPGPVAAHLVPEFLCPSDSNARRGRRPAPISYRANVGPGNEGRGGPFSPGRTVKIADAEAAAGSEFSAAFAERLLGSGPGGTDPTCDYRVGPGPVGRDACPTGPGASWRGDAGSSWARADWTSTLYSHAITPNAEPSCIAQDGRTARMGASSAHRGRVNVLMLGGSVRGVTPRIDPEVWRKFAGVAPGDR